MPENYITLSLETHLFFARIMKEHALFLAAGFPCQNDSWIQTADYYRQQFENLLSEVVRLSNGRVDNCILHSGELVTEFTIRAEKVTERLSGLPINTEISHREMQLGYEAPQCEMQSCSGIYQGNDSELFQTVQRLNENSVWLLDGLIEFKESILKHVSSGNLFTFNYPLLIEHILREAKLYRSIIEKLMNNRQISCNDLSGTETFWNQIMMEHALFIRGLLDPSEEELIMTANDFAMDYKQLLKQAKDRDCLAMQELSVTSLEETLRYRDFKAAGTEGILNCEIASLILPLLADHVLREANHYIRILKNS